MKRIISLSLVALMLVTLLLTATSCAMSMESMTGYTQLRDHVTEKADEKGEIPLDGSAMGFASVSLSAPIEEDESTPASVLLVAKGGSKTQTVCLTLTLTGSPEKALLTYRILDAGGKATVSAEATILLTHYTGNDTVEFTSMKNIHPADEQMHRDTVSSMLNAALKTLDVYTTKNLDMDLHDLGFIALSDKYMADVDEVVAEEDLGAAFSPERLSMAGLMIIQGVGMVFLVLAILWLVLLLFKKVFYKDPAKAEKAAKAEKKPEPAPEAPAPAPVPAPAPAAAPGEDGALVAAITAAVAAYIDSDPALASQFASGFRVVSFKPTSKNRNR